MRQSAAAGATHYDMWGLATPGIEHFKAGFGGREVRYLGGLELALDPLGRRLFALGMGLKARRDRLRRGRTGGEMSA